MPENLVDFNELLDEVSVDAMIEDGSLGNMQLRLYLPGHLPEIDSSLTL